MEGSSDPLLLTKKAQKLVKGSDGLRGTLTITQSKVKWLPDDRAATKPVVIEITGITKQQQAPGKPFLRIISAAEPLGLAFSSEEDKNEVLEVLKQLKPTSGNAAAAGGKPAAGVPTAAQRQQLFAADKDLETLYGQLVVSSILAEADFWRTRQGALARLAATASGRPPVWPHRQQAGLSSVLHDVERLHDGQSERVNIHLTPQDIQRIFTERPEVHRAFLAHVPHALPEKEFWERYFKLEYKKAARRKRLAAAGRLDVGEEDLEEDDELFAPFRRQVAEQERLRSKAKMRSVDPTVNLAAADADGWPGVFATGQAAVRLDQAAASAAREGLQRHGIARDLNRHAAAVLEGALEGLAEMEPGEGGTAGIAARVAAAVQAAQRKQAPAVSAAVDVEVSPETLEQWRLRASAALDDLSLGEQEPGVPLEIQDPRAYFSSAAGAAKAAAGEAAKGGAQGAAAAAAAVAAVDACALRCPPCDPSLAAAALFEVGRDEDEALVAEFGPVAAAALGTHPKDALGSVMVEFFRCEALKTNELLRHFWGCLPLTSVPRQNKAAKLATHLEEQRKGLAAHMRTRPGTPQQVYVTQMLRPLAQALDAALERYQEDAGRRGKMSVAG